jgi:ElaB/YqjD/DUF883 family membrane-anchored ribosome-binding protein
MSNHAERLLDDLQQLVAQFEELAKSSLGGAEAHVGESAERLQAGIRRARERLERFEKEFGRGLKDGAHAAEHYVREQPWKAIGIAAAAAFLLGLLAARRD